MHLMYMYIREFLWLKCVRIRTTCVYTTKFKRVNINQRNYFIARDQAMCASVLHSLRCCLSCILLLSTLTCNKTVKTRLCALLLVSISQPWWTRERKMVCRLNFRVNLSVGLQNYCNTKFKTWVTWTFPKLRYVP